MSVCRTSEQLPLTGADCFLRALDYEARRYHGASHLAQMVVRLGPGFDLDRFERGAVRVMREHPVLRASIRRRFSVGVPAYVLPDNAGERTRLALRVTQGEIARAGQVAAIPAVFFDRLNDTYDIGRGDLLRFDVVRYGSDNHATDLAITWAHMLFDASGSERFLAYLAEVIDAPEATRQATRRAIGTSWSLRGLREQAQIARRWGQHIGTLSSPAPRSLFGPLRRTPQRLRYELTTLTHAETQTVVDRSAQYVGFLTPVMFYLAASMRAHAAVFAQRHAEPESYLVPLPARFREPEDGTFSVGTHVSFLWFRVLKEQMRDFGKLVDELKRQRLDQVRSGAIEETAAALDFVRLLPLRAYADMLRRNLHGELATFLFAFTGQLLPGLHHFAGAEIVNAFHAPAVQPSPGSGLIMSIRGGALNITHMYQEGVLTDQERSVLLAHLRTDLLGTKIA